MKATAWHCTKMTDLMRILGLPRWGAVGVMESLWKFAAVDAPKGDIGRKRNSQIAAGIEWVGDPDRLIDGLVEADWLKPDPYDRGSRLIIHDHCQHCEDSVHTKVAREYGFFACCGKAPKLTGLRKSEKPKFERWYALNSVIVGEEKFAPWSQEPNLFTPRKPAQPDSTTAMVRIPTQERSLSLWTPPVPAPVVADKTVREFRDIPALTSEELEEAWSRHKIQRARQPKNLIFSQIFDNYRSGTFDLVRFRKNHPIFCRYWTRKGWKMFGQELSLWDWIETGMELPAEAGVDDSQGGVSGYSKEVDDLLSDYPSGPTNMRRTA